MVVRLLIVLRLVALALFVGVAAIVAPAGGVRAADTGWTIDSFRAVINVDVDASFTVREEIDVDFGALEKHGIFREVPIEYNYDSTHDRLYGFEAISVTDAAGTPLHYEQSRNGANVRLKIGDANRTVSGKQSYRITYRIRDALNAFADHDELFWNVNGPDWGVPTLRTSADIAIAGATAQRVDCFQGVTGSKAHCIIPPSDETNDALFGASGTLQPGEQLTIVVAIPKGAVAEPAAHLIGKPKNKFEQYFQFNPLTIGASIFALIAGIVLVVLNWWRRGRDRVYTSIYYLSHNPEERTRPFFARDEIVVEYTPPDDLRPAQMGLLLDERADTKDVSATIVDLAVRGYLTIEELDKKWVFGSKDWRLTKKKEGADLQPYERTILDGLFETGPQISLSDIKNKYADTLKDAEGKLYADGVKRAWFAQSPDSARNAWHGAGFGVAIAGAAIGYGLGRWFGAALVGVPIVITGVLLLLSASGMSKRTAAGSEALRRVLGFRLYISTAETDRQKFNEQANIFAAYLPYAIVFGCVEKWARVFRDIDTTAATHGWYIGPGPFFAPDFSRSLESFSSSVSSVIASTPGASGGSGFSGGSSGGGGGGGGGGSW